MRRTLIIMSAIVGMMLAGTAAIAGEGDDNHEFPEHPHLLVQRPEIGLIDHDDDAETDPVLAVVAVRKCVDLANNQRLPLQSQHHNVHFGTAGAMLFSKAGHAVVPAYPFPGIPWKDCEDFEDMLPIPMPAE